MPKAAGLERLPRGVALNWAAIVLLTGCGAAAGGAESPEAGATAGSTDPSSRIVGAGQGAAPDHNRSAAGSGGAAAGAVSGASAAGASGASLVAGAGAAGRDSGAGDAGSAGEAGTAMAAAGAGRAAAGSGGAAGSAGPGASRCAGSDLLLCEDFEAASLDTSIWQAMHTPPTLDDTRAARGSQSLHVHTAATGASGLQTRAIFPRPGGRYYGRMFVYFEALPTSPQWAHWTIVGANPSQGSGETGEIRIGGQHDGQSERFGVGTDLGPSGDWTNLDDDPNGTPQPVPLRTWLCIEWLHDWANDETRFFVDGVEHPSLHTTRDVKHAGNSQVPYELPELGSVWIGFWNYDQGKPVTPDAFDLWIDEVAFDDERIGCDR